MLKRTTIMATVGPATSSPEMLRAVAEAGVDVFRINFSHGDEEQRDTFLTNIRAVEKTVQRPLAICGDLCGPKIRVGMMRDEPAHLEKDGEIVIQRNLVEGDSRRISTTFPEIVDVVQPGERILLADGRLQLEVLQTSPPDEFVCRVMVGGPLSSGKGINLPQTNLPISALTEKDRQDSHWIAERDFDFVALSFVRSADDVRELRRLLEDSGRSELRIIAKVEKPQALRQIDAIIAATDAVMVARGDLGVEMDYYTVPITQKSITFKCQRAGKSCIIATEMLESMIHSSRPTRAEVSDVANAVFDRADAVMLSAETSIGKYPIEAVTTMQRTVNEVECFLDANIDWIGVPPVVIGEPQTAAALAASIRTIMGLQAIKAIVVYTATGTSARLIAKNRPECPTIALTSREGVARRACLYYGVIPKVIDPPNATKDVLDQATSIVKELGIAAPGDHVIVVAGQPIGVHDASNALVIQLVE